MAVIIREATEFDLTPMLGLWQELVTFHEQFEPLFVQRKDACRTWLKFVRENMDKDTALVLVAEQDGKIVGLSEALITPYPPVFERERYGELMGMVVAPQARRQGVGTLLFTEMKRWYQQQDIDRIEVRAHVHNPISQPFWEKQGFQPYLKTYALEI